MIDMVKCPKCKMEIDYLKAEDWVSRGMILEVQNGREVYSDTEHYDDIRDEKFICPECNSVLFENEEEAVDFLNGKRVVKW